MIIGELREIIYQLLNVESLSGLRTLFKEVGNRCYILARHYSLLTPTEKSELTSLQNMQREIYGVMQLATPEMIRAAREVTHA